MQIVESFLINASQDDVWQLMFDIPRLSQCVPGLQSVEIVDDKTYRGKLVVRVGPLRSEFSGSVILTEIARPDRLAGTVQGADKSSASSIKANFTGRLKPVADGTEASFEVEANLRGRLAQFGGPVINATAKKLTAEFAKNLKAQLEHGTH
jgi:uncharacterized protein